MPAPRPPSAPAAARARARAELTSEIKAHALDQLAVGGGSVLSLRGIARDMGMASSALFRYFPSRDALLTALIIDSYEALANSAEAAEARAHGGSVADRWLAICHGVRAWSVAHPHEYALIFGSPIPGYAAPQDTVPPASRVPLLIAGLLGNSWPAGAHRPAAGREPPPAAARALDPVRHFVAPGGADEAVVRALMAWTYLFGAVSFEVFGHRHNVIGDHEAFFDHEVHQLAVMLDLPGAAAS